MCAHSICLCFAGGSSATFVPLDMLFVAADGKVVRVVENTEPMSEKTIQSSGIVLGVVELPAGAAARLKIAQGVRVLHSTFSNQ